jgi:hypothetical protein
VRLKSGGSQLQAIGENKDCKTHLNGKKALCSSVFVIPAKVGRRKFEDCSPGKK